MPARLADGLGLESGLGALRPRRSPHPGNHPRYSGPPRPASGRKPDLGCSGKTVEGAGRARDCRSPRQNTTVRFRALRMPETKTATLIKIRYQPVKKVLKSSS